MKYITALLLLIIVTACVTQKKYDDLLSEKIQLESDLAQSKDSLESSTGLSKRLNDRVNSLQRDTSALGKRIRNANKELNDLKNEHQQLKTYYDNLLNNSGKLNRDLAEQQEHLLSLKENLEQTRKVNEKLSADLSEREKKVKELENILENKEKAVQELKKKITNALLSFKENDLTVEVKNGKVYVSLAEQLLFKSGSTVVDTKGVTALQQLAKALKGQKDIHVMVEGHTDNVPISKTTQYMNDNWDLSVLRATSIIRILTQAGVASDQITAAGRGEFAPVESNESAQGRQKNRRTEIIITPDLDELFKILETN